MELWNRQWVSSILTTSSHVEFSAPTVTVPWLWRTQKERSRKQYHWNGINRQNLEVGKWALKAKSLILRNIPEPPCYGLEKLRMRKVSSSSFPQHLHQDNHYWTSRILISRLQAESGKSQQGTSRNKLPQPKEKLNKRRDHSQADKLLVWSTTSSRSEWRQWGHFGLQRFIKKLN